MHHPNNWRVSLKFFRFGLQAKICLSTTDDHRRPMQPRGPRVSAVVHSQIGRGTTPCAITMSGAAYNHLIQVDDDRRFRDFVGRTDVRTGHDPNWDPGVVGWVRLVRAGWYGCVRGLNVSRKKRPGGAIISIDSWRSPAYPFGAC